MTDQDDLSSILDRILAGDRTEVDIEKLRQSLRVDGDVVQLVSQDGKFNTNIGKIEGGTFHIGDVHQGADSETIERIILKALQDTLQLQSQKPLTYLTGSDGLGALSDVPELPVKFLPRPNDLEPLKALLIDSSSQTNTVTGKTHKVGIQGMGGIGKSVLAAALAREEAVRRQFSNGIVWIRLGYDRVNPIDEQIKIARALTNEPQSFVSIQEGKVFLENLLRDTACLLILDDVWHLDQIEAFNVLGVHCQMVITTRDTGIIATLGAEPYQLDVLSNAQALQLLAQASEQEIETLPAAVQTVAEECGNLPLALAMIGAMAKGDPTIWFDLLELLQSADLVEIEAEFRDKYPYPNLLRAMKVSVDGLKPEEQECYFDFAVFPQDTPIPIGVLQTFWQPKGLNKIKQKKIIDSLVNRSLIRRDNVGRLTLHDLQLDYVRQQVKDLPVLHNRLLNAYQAQCPQGWHTYSPDGYFFEWLPHHLKQADRTADLQALLLDYPWLQAKLDNTGVNPLLADYDLLPEPQYLQLVQGAIKLSSHILRHDPKQLPGQLLGRLLPLPEPAIQLLLKQLKQTTSFPWLRPIVTNLTPPNGALLLTLEGHQDCVRTIVLTPDGKHVLSIASDLSSNDNTLKIWNIENGQLIHSLEVDSLDFDSFILLTSNGKYAVTGKGNFRLEIWNIEDGQLLHSLEHQEPVMLAVLTPDGKRVVSASCRPLVVFSEEKLLNDNTLKIWSVEQGLLLHVLEGHQGVIFSVVITPDGKRAVSASSDQTLKVWDMEKGQLLHTLEGHNDVVKSVVLTPDGKRVISALSNRTLKIWDVEQGQLLHTLEGHNDSINAFATTPDGKRVISASSDRTLRVWDIDQGRLLHTLEGHTDSINTFALTPNGKRVISASSDQTLKVWDVDQGQLLHTLEGHTDSVKSVVVTPDGKRAISSPPASFFFSHSNDKTLKVWDLDHGKLLGTLKGHQGSINAFALTPDGNLVISASSDRTLKVWDLRQDQLLNCSEQHQDYITDIVLTPNGKYAVSTSFDRTLKVWDVDQGQLLHTLEGHNGSVESVVLTPNGKRVISASSDRTLKVWDIEQGQLLHTLEGHQDPIQSVVLTPDGNLAISISWDHTLKVWDVDKGQLLHTLQGDQTEKYHVTFGTGERIWSGCIVVSPDSKRAISTSDSNRLYVWDIKQGQLLQYLEDNSPDPDIKSYVWDPREERSIPVLEKYRDPITAVSITPDGKYAISISESNRLHFWDIAQGQWLEFFERSQRQWLVVPTPDSKHAISTYDGKTLEVWSIEQSLWQQLYILEGHQDKVVSIVLTPDGKRAVSRSNKILNLWDLEQGQLISSFSGDGEYSCFALAPNGNTIIAGDRTGRVHFLQLEGWQNE
jgi:WD40 repeat protein